jgi:hypothetical protein
MISAEVLADLVASDVLDATGSHWVKVAVHQTDREGIPIDVTARQPVDVQQPSQDRNSHVRSRHIDSEGGARGM